MTQITQIFNVLIKKDLRNLRHLRMKNYKLLSLSNSVKMRLS